MQDHGLPPKEHPLQTRLIIDQDNRDSSRTHDTATSDIHQITWIDACTFHRVSNNLKVEELSPNALLKWNQFLTQPLFLGKA